MTRNGLYTSLLSSLLLSLGFSAIAGTAEDTGASEPSLVIVGGALSAENRAVFRAVLERRGDGPICVLPTASAEPESSMDSYLADFHRYGGDSCDDGSCAVGIRITQDDAAKAQDPEVAATLRQCGGYFFTGGDQSRIVDVFRPAGVDSPAYEALRQVLESGGVIAGSSAGAAMMSDPMIGGGSSRAAFRPAVLGDGVISEDPLETGAEGVWVRCGMGFLPHALVDQHFLERGRFGRLWVAMAGTGLGLGFGVGEDTALVIDGVGTDTPRAQVVGPSGVLVVEAAESETARLWLLGDGDHVRWDDSGDVREASPGDGKRPVVASSAQVRAPKKIWRDDAFHRLLVDLAMSLTDEVRLRGKDRRLLLSKADGFVASGPPAASRGSESLFAGPYLVRRMPGDG